MIKKYKENITKLLASNRDEQDSRINSLKEEIVKTYAKINNEIIELNAKVENSKVSIDNQGEFFKEEQKDIRSKIDEIIALSVEEKKNSNIYKIIIKNKLKNILKMLEREKIKNTNLSSFLKKIQKTIDEIKDVADNEKEEDKQLAVPVASLVRDQQYNIIDFSYEDFKACRVDISSEKIRKLDVNTTLLGNLTEVVHEIPGFLQNISNMGLYRFTQSVDTSTLMKTKEGFSTIAKEGGKISKHYGLEQVSSTLNITISVFQALSIITAQYYLEQLNKKLNSILSKVEGIIKLLNNERLGKILGSMEYLRNISNSFLNSMDENSKHRYANQIENIFRETIQIKSSCLLNTKNVKENLDKTELSCWFFDTNNEKEAKDIINSYFSDFISHAALCDCIILQCSQYDNLLGIQNYMTESIQLEDIKKDISDFEASIKKKASNAKWSCFKNKKLEGKINDYYNEISKESDRIISAFEEHYRNYDEKKFLSNGSTPNKIIQISNNRIEAIYEEIEVEEENKIISTEDKNSEL